MAPRTYLRKQAPVSISKSAMAINALFAKNIVKKYHSKGHHINDSSSLLDNSLHLNKIDDTFTRIVRGENYQNVCYTKNNIPYESLALSRSTVDIHSQVIQSDKSCSELKLKNNCSSMNDGCISKSLILIQSWDEPRDRFVTQRKKSRRKAHKSIVKAKTLRKTKYLNSSRSYASKNERNQRQDQSGARMSNRLSVRAFKGFSNADIRKAAEVTSIAENNLSLIENAPRSETYAELGFPPKCQIDAYNRKRLSINESIRLNATCTDEPFRKTCLQDSSIQNDSCLPSINNSILCENFMGKHTSTPLTKTRRQYVQLEESIAASPIVARQTRGRTYVIHLNKIYATENTTDDEISSYKDSKDSSVKKPCIKKISTNCPISKRKLRPRSSSLKGQRLIQRSVDEISADIPAKGKRPYRSSLFEPEIIVSTTSTDYRRMLRSRSCPPKSKNLIQDSVDEVSIITLSKRKRRSRIPSFDPDFEVSTTSPNIKKMLRPRSCPPKREFGLEMKSGKENTDEEVIAAPLVKRWSRGRPPKKKEEFNEKGGSLKPEIEEKTSHEESSMILTDLIQHRARHLRPASELYGSIQLSSATSMKENPRRGRPSRIEQSYFEEALSPRQKRREESNISFAYDDDIERGPVALRTRSQSRSRTELYSSSLNFTNEETCSCMNKQLKRRKCLGGTKRNSALQRMELNKENIIIGSPCHCVLRTRKTIAEERPNQNVNKADKHNTIPASRMSTFCREESITTRLQSRLLLQSSENYSNNKNRITDLKHLRYDQSLATMNNNTEDVNDLNNVTANIELDIDLQRIKINQTPVPFNITKNIDMPEETELNTSIRSNIKQEPIEMDERYTDTDRLNYDIEDPSSPGPELNINSNSMSVSQDNQVTSNNVFTSIKQSPISLVASELDVKSECLYINNVRQKHEFAIPLNVVVQRKVYCPGKKYRRSIFSIRREIVFGENTEQVVNLSKSIWCENRRSSIRLEPIRLQQNLSGTNNVSTRETGFTKPLPQRRNSVYVEDNSIEQEVHVFERFDSLLNESVEEVVAAKTAKAIILRNCDQDKPQPWETYYADSVLDNCSKIGEGVYGEVFMFRNAQRTTSVMKVIPIEGDHIVNGEPQKKFQDVLSEIVIAKNLGSLSTSGFNRLEAVHLICGAYPEKLLDHWHIYNEAKGSENDCPDKFQTDTQLYLVLQLEHGGKDLESYTFKNAMEAYSIYVQLVHSLAQAEEQFAFEHRDLHWGNVLISDCPTSSNLTYTLSDGTIYTVKTHGVRCNIIDFTLSRMTMPRGEGVVETTEMTTEEGHDWVLYNDLKDDEGLFGGEGDVQFDVYRQMRTETGDNWKQFCPKTTLYWLNYILQKMLTDVVYSQPKSRTHKTYMNKIRRCRSRILTFSCCIDVVKCLP